MNKVLVFGKNGRLAKALAKIKPEYNYISSTECDVRDEAAVEATISKYKPLVVINCAAQTDMEACEKNEASCALINTRAVENIALSCIRHHAYLLHISTDFAAEPVNAYGRTKREAENYAVKAGTAIRVNFYTEESFIIKKVKEKKPFVAYTNIFFNPISITTFSQMLVEAAEKFLEDGEKKYLGLVAIGTKDKLSVYEFALMVCDVFAVDRSIVSEGFYDGTGLVRKPDTYIKPINSLDAKEDLENFHDITR